MYEFKDHKDKSVRDTLNLASELSLETMTSKLESMDIYFKLNEITKNFSNTDATLKDKLAKFLQD